ncbi:MAG: type I DNA topoisomerase [bacterium]|nr:type I DNA topoisomerase [bacterium]
MGTSGNKKLVIVESPAKARSIGRILGSDYILMASMGHVRDLPQKTLGVDVSKNFKPEYKNTKSTIIKDLTEAAKKADTIYLATDPDREGEAIAWHLQELLKKKTDGEFERVEFHEITKNAIKKAFESTCDINKDLVDSQQARRILDRLVGYQVSPLLWSQVKRNISAGRVQSVALRIVCEREREILSFVPKEYWNFSADLLWKNESDKLFTTKLVLINNKKVDITNKKQADEIYNTIKSEKALTVKSSKTEKVKKHAPPPFITSTLQQAAGSALRFPANKTMQVAQQLYEGMDLGNNDISGLITYMRTDSFTISKDAQEQCRNYIKESYGENYIPLKPNIYKNKSTAQEAHEAIRPTDITRTPKSMLTKLNKDQFSLYNLIWTRFLASQMIAANISKSTVDSAVKVNDNEYIFRAISTTTVFPGFSKVLGSANQDNNKNKPDFLYKIEQGDSCTLDSLSHEQKFTEPPPRYTEPSLIKELEANGIGRPSTYATIVNTIQNRKYVLKEKGKLIPEDLGFKVNDYLVKTLPDLFNIGFTAEMENELDKVEDGDEVWSNMLQIFYDHFSKWLQDAKYNSAPAEEKVTNLFDILNKVKEWAPAEKKGTRTYNDQRFYSSIVKQHDKNSKLTSKQWESLLKLALKYEDQLPELNSLAEKHKFASEITDLKEDIKLKEIEKEKNNEEISEKLKNFKAAFKLFDDVKFDKENSFNEESFVKSLSDQVEAGRNLSSKQLYVLKKIGIANKDTMSNFTDFTDLLGISETEITTINSMNNVDNEKKEEIEKFIKLLDNINSWDEPTQKGKRKFDDKSFYTSLKKQFESKKNLSPKQYYALKKLVSKYEKK